MVNRHNSPPRQSTMKVAGNQVLDELRIREEERAARLAQTRIHPIAHWRRPPRSSGQTELRMPATSDGNLRAKSHAFAVGQHVWCRYRVDNLVYGAVVTNKAAGGRYRVDFTEFELDNFTVSEEDLSAEPPPDALVAAVSTPCYDSKQEFDELIAPAADSEYALWLTQELVEGTLRIQDFHVHRNLREVNIRNSFVFCLRNCKRPS